MEHRQSLLKSTTAYFLILLMLVQSCVVYQTTPTTLNTAVNNGPVKLVNEEGKVYKFKSVGSKNEAYFGTGSAYSDLEFIMTPEGMLTPLDSTQFNAIYLKDVRKSKIRSVWLGVGLALPTAYFLLLGFVIFVSYGGI